MKFALGKTCFHYSWEEHLGAFENDLDLVDIQSVDLEDFFKKHGTQYLLTLCFGDCFYLESYEFSASLKTSILFTSRYHIELLDNKLSMIKYFIDNDMQHYIPKTYMIVMDGNKLIYDNNIEYPIVIKPKHGMSGYNVRICKDQNDFDEKVKYYGKNYAIQKYVQHDYECSGYFLCDKGKILARLTCEGVSGKGLYIKNQRIGNPIYNTVDTSQFDKIFEKLCYTGFANADFKMVGDRLYLFEINPRMGGDLICNENIMDLLNQVIDR
jgi:glutathione synthase/RimK-type ligase-like ATP-grasp enzyme